MPSNTIRIGTRGSQLALWQAEQAKTLLEGVFPGRTVTIVPVKTGGDKDQVRPLAAMGGVGVFVKELEQELLKGTIDVAVHSAKDIPVRLEDGMALVATLPRGRLNDALVSRNHVILMDLPCGAQVGTSSPRRKAQLLRKRPDLQISTIRGNVDTRLRKVREGEFDATLMASAGLHRLGLESNIDELLDLKSFLPAPCQGIVAIEAREKDRDLCEAIATAGDAISMAMLWAERAFLAAIGAGCSSAVAGISNVLSDGSMEMHAAVYSLDGTRCIQIREAITALESPQLLGEKAAQTLLDQGAGELLVDE